MKNKLFFITYFCFFSTTFVNYTTFASDNYNSFTRDVISSFEKEKNITHNDNKDAKTISRQANGKIFDFSQTLEENYENFANDRYKHDDYVDAFYFQTKAKKIKNYKIISPANPYSFGILPDDMQQFVMAREQLKNVSINSIINSNDGIVLADSYIAFDCWLEAFEEGNSNDRMERCRNRFLDNMKAIRLSLLSQGYNLFEMTTKDDLVLNSRLTTCESCALYSQGYYCNTLYFEPEEARMLDKMNIVIKRLQRKMSYFASSNVDIMYYKNAYGYNQTLMTKRLNAMKNLAYNTLANNSPIKPTIQLKSITLPKENLQKKIFRDAITICIKGNE